MHVVFLLFDHLLSQYSNQASRSEEHTSELQSQSNLVCRLLLEKKKKIEYIGLVSSAEIADRLLNEAGVAADTETRFTAADHGNLWLQHASTSSTIDQNVYSIS